MLGTRETRGYRPRTRRDEAEMEKKPNETPAKVAHFLNVTCKFFLTDVACRRRRRAHARPSGRRSLDRPFTYSDSYQCVQHGFNECVSVYT